MLAWRVCKARHLPYDGTGALRLGARWSSPGRPVIYASDSLAGAILEILAHALRPRTLPGAHHGVRIEVPAELVEEIEPGAVPGWELAGAEVARRYGDRWFDEARTAALRVPALPCRPDGRNLLLNPLHPAAGAIVVSAPFPVPWDERLF